MLDYSYAATKPEKRLEEFLVNNNKNVLVCFLLQHNKGKGKTSKKDLCIVTVIHKEERKRRNFIRRCLERKKGYRYNEKNITLAIQEQQQSLKDIGELITRWKRNTARVLEGCWDTIWRKRKEKNKECIAETAWSRRQATAERQTKFILFRRWISAAGTKERRKSKTICFGKKILPRFICEDSLRGTWKEGKQRQPLLDLIMAKITSSGFGVKAETLHAGNQVDTTGRKKEIDAEKMKIRRTRL